MTRTPTRRGVQFGPAEQNVLAVIDEHGLRTLRYDGAPCELVRAAEPAPSPARPDTCTLTWSKPAQATSRSIRGSSPATPANPC